MKKITAILPILLIPFYLTAADLDFQIEKQKTKLALEYENLAATRGENISFSGVQVSYLLKGKGSVASRAFLNFDLQSGVKLNPTNSFSQGELSPFILSNRASTILTVPIKKLYLSGGFLFRNKWFKDTGLANHFVDVFGGEAFRELTYSLQLAYPFAPSWEVTLSVEKSDLNYKDFPGSNSDEQGLSMRVSRKWADIKLNVIFTRRNVQYNRFISGGIVPAISPVVIFEPGILQKDRFWEVGGSLEFVTAFYFVGGYSYQINNSNNEGFSYKNHRFSLLFSKELSHSFYLQAFGIFQLQDFVEENLTFPGTLLLEENQYNSMAASLVKSMNPSSEIEFGFQNFTHDSSFRQLNASKYIVFCAYNYRF